MAVKILPPSEMLLFLEKIKEYIQYGFRPEMTPHLVVNIKMPCTHFIWKYFLSVWFILTFNQSVFILKFEQNTSPSHV